ncbi:MAG: patatin-like phospholipase family protein [Hyphomonadaceae bacterium]|nr:patatin-like phospholipase family protein [Hyphomonadaceae bacterium]
MRIAAVAFAALATSCASAPDTTPINQTLRAPPPAPVEIELGVDGDAIALALSGGGARAASFSLGVLLQLRDMKGPDGRALIDKVALVTSVSGGSTVAAWFGLHGAGGLDGFRAAMLDKDWQSQLHTTFVSPENWQRLMQGGVNGPDKLGDWLDNEVYSGAHMKDLSSHPRVIINAADLYNGTPFAFATPYFQAICSDLGSVRVADAVAASMSVPIAFRPIVVKLPEGECPVPMPSLVDAAKRDRASPALLRETARAFEAYRDPSRMKYLHLTDGGVADNFGLSSLVTIRRAAGKPYGPYSARDAVRIRRMTFLLVNSERNADGNWAMKPEGPDAVQLADALLSVSINAPKRAASDAFGSVLADWQRDLIAWRCELTPAEARALGAGEGWTCTDVQFRFDTVSFADLPPDQYERLGAAATAVSLPKDQVDDLIAGGRRAILTNELLQTFTR